MLLRAVKSFFCLLPLATSVPAAAEVITLNSLNSARHQATADLLQSGGYCLVFPDSRSQRGEIELFRS